MDAFRSRSTSEQLTDHLRREILRGSLGDIMPGIRQLVSTLGVNSRAVELALKQLETEGLLEHQGNRRSRRIILPKDIAPKTLRIQILLHGVEDAQTNLMIDILHRLLDAGHHAAFATRGLEDLGMNTQRISRFVRNTPADAWVVVAGSREVLDWFAAQSFPTFALYGRMRSLPIAGAGPDKKPAYQEAARRLIELGHRRISLLVEEERRKPSAGVTELAFLNEMEAAGIPTGSYNLPDWPVNEEGFRKCIDSLFARTPPTALLVDGPVMFHAAMLHLSQKGILAPRDVSLICSDPDPTFAWCKPSIAHIYWDTRPLVRAVLRWADHSACGQEDLQKSFTKTSFIEGGTVGPAPKNRA